MKLLVTGAFAQDEKDLIPFQNMGFDVVFHRNEKDELPCAPSEIEAAFCNGLFLHHDIAKFTNLKAIQLTSAGLDRVPVAEIERRGIQLYNARGVYSVPMAEYAVAEVLSVYQGKRFYRACEASKRWEKKRDLDELFDKTVCVVGAGNVGGEVAKRFKGFGCKTIGVDAFPNPRPEFEEVAPIAQLFEKTAEADVVVSTLPLFDSTRGLFNKAFFENMKSTAIFVNISRGAVVDQAGLVEALRAGDIRHAVLDVFEEEPLPQDSPLWELENATVTPHCSYISSANKKRLTALAIENFSKIAKQ